MTASELMLRIWGSKREQRQEMTVACTWGPSGEAGIQRDGLVCGGQHQGLKGRGQRGKIGEDKKTLSFHFLAKPVVGEAWGLKGLLELCKG